MSKPFWGFFGVGLVAVAAWAALVWFGNVSNHLVLKGTILKVRTAETSDGGSIAVIDFRLKNPSAIQFVVKTVEMTMEPATGEVAKSFMISKSDMNSVFQSHPAMGPRFNEVLSLQDKIEGGQTLDWMVAARFEVSASALDKRKIIHLHIEDVDGTVADLTEAP